MLVLYIFKKTSISVLASITLIFIFNTCSEISTVPELNQSFTNERGCFTGLKCPDLIVSITEVNDTAFTTTEGISFTTSTELSFIVTVKNLGNAESLPSTLNFYTSKSPDLPPNDAVITSHQLHAISERSSSFLYIPTELPTSPAQSGSERASETYYYIACTDHFLNETNTANNCSIPYPITAYSGTATNPSPALEIPDLSVIVAIEDEFFNTIAQDYALTLNYVILNNSTTVSPASYVDFYQSDDNILDTALDPKIKTSLIMPTGFNYTTDLDELDSLILGSVVIVPKESGTYYYFACIKDEIWEQNYTNNCSSQTPLYRAYMDVVDPSNHDLNIADFKLTNNEPITANTVFTFKTTVKNTGTSLSPETRLIYFSLTSEENNMLPNQNLYEVFTGKEPLYIAQKVERLSGNSTSGGIESPLIQATDMDPPLMDQEEGYRYFYVCVVPYPNIGNDNSIDNCAVKQVTIVGPSATNSPDLSIALSDDTERSLAPADMTAGLLDYTVTIDPTTSMDITLRYYYAKTTHLPDNRQDENGNTLPRFNPRKVFDVTNHFEMGYTSGNTISNPTFTRPEPGEYYFFACVDIIENESNIENNCSKELKVTVNSP